MRPLRLAALLALPISVASCVLPPAVTVASFAADGISLVATGKTVSDHALSTAANEDCRMWRLLTGGPVCRTASPAPVAMAAPSPAPVAASSAPALLPDPTAALPSAAPPTAPGLGASSAPHSSPSPTALAAPSPPASEATLYPAPLEAIPTVPSAKLAPAPRAGSGKPVPPSPVGVPSGPPVHAEFIIESGTSKDEAQAFLARLRGMPAAIRPVRQGEATVYQVVVGLSD